MDGPETAGTERRSGRPREAARPAESAAARDLANPRPSKVPRVDGARSGGAGGGAGDGGSGGPEEKGLGAVVGGGANGRACPLEDGAANGIGAPFAATDSGEENAEIPAESAGKNEMDVDLLYGHLPESPQAAAGETAGAKPPAGHLTAGRLSAANGEAADGRDETAATTNETLAMTLRTGEMFEEEMPPAAFVLRPPVRPEEVDAARSAIKEVLDEAHEKIKTDGYGEFKRWVNRHLENGDDAGMDSEEEAEAERIRAEQSLEEAVVRGNPRRYQMELFEIAKTRNTIVNLGTGQGKTLVALLLIRHMAEPAFQEGKQTWFLVPSIALAVQHRITLKANLPFSVEVACHQSSNTEKARKNLAEANIVVATHGSAMDLLNHYGDMFHFSRVNLLVIDECHYASGNHRYTHIMDRHYKTLSPGDRPRVLGLTASPFVNVKKGVSPDGLESMLRSLEEMLDCTLATLPGMTGRGGNVDDDNDSDSEDEESEYTPTNSAEERVVYYHSADMANHLPSHFGLELHESRISEFNQLQRLYHELGPKAVAVYSATLARECSRNKWLNESHEEFLLVKSHLQNISEHCLKHCETCPNGGRTEKLAVLEELLEDVVEDRGGIDEEEGEKDPVGVVFVDMRITALALYDYFRARKREMAKGSWIPVRDTEWSRRPKAIEPETFSSQGNVLHDSDDDDPVAAAIRDASMVCIPDVDILPTLDSNEPHVDANEAIDKAKKGPKNELRCEVLVRHCTQVFKYLDKSNQPLYRYSVASRDSSELGTSNSGGLGASPEPWLHQQKKIRDVLDGMRRGKTNVLIATSLVEEGVDVAACSFVIVFDRLRSSKSYVQMKGRARRKNASLYVFQDSHPRAQALKVTTLKTAQEVEQKVQRFLEARAALGLDNVLIRRLFLPRKKYSGSSISAEERALEEGEYRSENGVVDLSSAKSLLNRYAISIPLDMSAKLSRERLLLHMPSHNDDDTIVTLPSHLPSDVRCVELPESYRNHGGDTIAGRRDRRAMLALMACVRLHSLKLLNSRLLPLRHRDMHERLLKVALTRLPRFEPIAHANVPSHSAEEEDREVHIYALHQSGSTFSEHDKALKGNGRVLCLISTAPLPEKIPGLTFRHSELGYISVELGPPMTAKLSSAQWEECSEFYTALMNARFRKRSKNQWYRYSATKAKAGQVMAPHIVGCLDKNGALDWERIRKVIRDYARSEQDRINAVTSLNLDELTNLPEPRVVCPQYDPQVKYIAYGDSQITCSSSFPSEGIKGVKTYQDYFRERRSYEVAAECKLLAVQRFWHLPRRVLRERAIEVLQKKAAEEETEILQLQKGESAPCKGLVSCLLPHQACMECQFLSDANLFLHCIHLPHILFHTDRVLQTHAFVDYCAERLPKLGSYLKEIEAEEVMSAITAKSCTLENDYDKLEWLGDAVLKMIHTDTLLHSRELRKWVAILHEGDLSSLRAAMGSNKRLKDAAQSSGIARYVLIFCLGRGQWVPSCLEMYEITEDGEEVDAAIENVQPSDKVSADVMESLLGLIYINYGFQASVDVAVELGISLPRDPDMKTKPTVTPKEKFLAIAKSVIGKDDFRHPELLEEALTHPSAIHEDVPNYQRLEWVGDAVLCIAAREHVYKKYCYLGLAEMNIVESTFVCNETLAYLCVSNGLAQHIRHRDPCLPSRFGDFRQSVLEGGRGLWGTDPPKVLSDVIESMFGAAHVDGGFDDGQKAVHFTLKPIVNTVTAALQHGDEFNPNKYANDIFMHPKQELHEMGGGILQLRTWKEEDFAVCQIKCPLWCDDKWGEASEHGAGTAGVVQSLGINLLAALEPNTLVAKNRACALAVFAFHKSPELMETLKAISRCISMNRENDNDDDDEC